MLRGVVEEEAQRGHSLSRSILTSTPTFDLSLYLSSLDLDLFLTAAGAALTCCSAFTAGQQPEPHA